MWADNELLSALIASDNAPQLILRRVYRSLAQLHRHRAERANLFAIGFEAHNFTLCGEAAVAPLRQPIGAESDFGSGSSQTRTIFVLSDARKSFATSRQLSA
jgi:hypothetical protein